MKKKLLYALGAVLALAAYCWASNEDYVDHRVAGMKNCGAYDALSAHHSGASDARLVEIYDSARGH